MKKYILKLLCALCFIMPFLPNVMADPLDDFYKSFIDVTKNYNYCDNFLEMDKIKQSLELTFLEVIFKGKKLDMEKYKKEHPKESLIAFTEMIMDDKINPKKILDCKYFAIYLCSVLTDLKIKNWIIEVPFSKPGANDGHVANVYINPVDNKLYIADGALQALARAGKAAFGLENNFMLTFLAFAKPSFFAHVPIDNYCKSTNIDKCKCNYCDMNKNANEFMPYDKFMEEYQNYIGSLKK